MKEFKVKLATLTDVRDFAQAAGMQHCEIEVVSGPYTVDATSIMGLVSMDLNEPLTVRVQGSDEMANAFYRDIPARLFA